MEEDTEWSKLGAEEKKRMLFLMQKKTLCEFLARGAISPAQFEKSFGDLMKKMGLDEEGRKR